MNHMQRGRLVFSWGRGGYGEGGGEGIHSLVGL